MFCSRATAIISLRRNKQGWLTFGAVQLVGCILAIYVTMYCSRGISETLNFAVRVFSRLSETVRDDSPAQLREALFSACVERILEFARLACFEIGSRLLGISHGRSALGRTLGPQ